MENKGEMAVIYSDFRRNTERLTQEIDRLTEQTQLAIRAVVKSKENLGAIQNNVAVVTSEVLKAKHAWDNGEAIAISAATDARKAALAQTSKTIKEFSDQLNAAAQKADAATDRFKNAARWPMRVWLCLTIVVLLMSSVTGVIAARLFVRWFPLASPEQSCTQQTRAGDGAGPTLEAVYRVATAQERKAIRW